MKQKTLISKVRTFIFLLMVITIVLLPNLSQADGAGFTQYINSPSITFSSPSKQKLEALQVTVKASSQQPLLYVRFYNGDTTAESKVFWPTVKSTQPVTINGTQYYTQMVLEIPNAQLPKKNKTKTYTVASKATNLEMTKKVFTIKNVKNKYYEVSKAPNVTDVKLEGNKIKIETSSGSKMKSVVVKDWNTNSNVYSKSGINAKTHDFSINKTAVKLKSDDIYRLEITLKNEDGTYTYKQFAFKMVTNTNSTSNTTQNTPCKTHMYKSSTGKCVVCGAECKHDKDNIIYLKYKEKHRKICTECGKEWDKEDHNMKNNKCSVCGYSKSDNLKNVVSVNASPDITVKFENSNKFSNAKITVTSDDKKITNFTLSETDATGKVLKQLKKENPNKTSKTYTKLTNSYLNKTTHYFKLEATNAYGTTTRFIQIYVNKDKSAYLINAAPSINLNTTTANNKLRIEVQDGSGLNYLKVFDDNNNTKLVATKNNMTATKQFPMIDLDNYSAKNGKYKLKLEAQDSSSSKNTATIFVEFQLKDIKFETEENKTSSSSSGNSTPSSGGTQSDVGVQKTTGGNNNCEHEWKEIDKYASINSYETHKHYIKECKKCGKQIYKLELHEFITASSTQLKCKDCGTIKNTSSSSSNSKHQHTYVYMNSYASLSSESHKHYVKKCSTCGYQLYKVEQHRFSGGKCIYCGYQSLKNHTHTYKYTTFTPLDSNYHIATGTCTICGVKNQVKGKHGWISHGSYKQCMGCGQKIENLTLNNFIK